MSGIVSAMSADNSEFYWGKYYDKTQIIKSSDGANIIKEAPIFKGFKYSIVDEKSKTYNQTIKNLITERTTEVVKTIYSNIPFAINDYVQLNNNNKYIIEQVAIITQEVAPQSMGLFKMNPNSFAILSLIRVFI